MGQNQRIKGFTARLGIAVAVSSVAVVGVQFVGERHADASTVCTSGSVATSTVLARNYSGPPREVYDSALASDTAYHRYTRVLFAASGNTEAQCTWVAPVGMRKAQLLVVGGGGAGGDAGRWHRRALRRQPQRHQLGAL